VSRYTADSRDRVRDAVDMLALVGSRVDLRRAGVDSYFGCCPFHDERTPSFHVRPDEKHYHCFGCSESGDPFDFVMQAEGLDFKGALESLADRFGVTLQTEEESPEAAALRERRERLYSLLTRATTYYARYLWEAREAAPAREYLHGRGFTQETLREFRVGYAPSGWERLVQVSRGAGFTDAELLEAGLAQRSKRRPSELIDRFRGRIMFPTADARGRVRGFGARAMSAEQRPKYLNTSDSDLYHKREVLYGIALARQAAARAGRMILVEGYTDVLALHQAGLRNCVGIMGTSLTREQVAELVRVVGVLELCLDADRAGQDAMVRAAELAAGSKLELRVVPLPPDTDPGDLIAQEGGEALRALVEASVPYVVFEVGRILDRADRSTAEGKDRAIAELREPMSSLPSSILRDEQITRIAAALSLSEVRVISLLGPGGAAPVRAATASGNGDRPAPAAPVPVTVAGQELRIERSFLAMCLAAPELGAAVLAEFEPDRLLSGAILRRAARHLAAGHMRTPLAGLPAEDDELARTMADLVDRASRGSEVSADALEHSRLLLELGAVEREMSTARAEKRPGIGALARRRQEIRASLGDVVSRLETPG
jgi:DNA primase